MLFSLEWVMFHGPRNFPSNQGQEVESMKIKKTVGPKISHWPKFDYFTDFF